MLIGTKNGVMCLKSGTFREGLPVDLITQALAVDYIAGAACPNWDRFISRILPDKEIAAYAQKIAGYSLTALTNDTAFYFLYGTGKNGKSIFVRTLATLFGSYGQKARSTIVEEAKYDGEPRFDLGRLAGVRCLYGEESKQGARLSEPILKSPVSGDSMTGEEKFLPPFTFTPRGQALADGQPQARDRGDRHRDLAARPLDTVHRSHLQGGGDPTRRIAADVR